MQLMTFGAMCSPASAQFVKNVHAKKFVDQHPRAVESIINHHYVDDLLDSVDTITEAVKLANEIITIQSMPAAGLKFGIGYRILLKYLTLYKLLLIKLKNQSSQLSIQPLKRC